MAKKILSEKMKEQYTDFDPGKLYSSPATGKQPVDEEIRAGRLQPVQYAEKRTRRVQLVCQPALHDQAVERSRRLGFRSFNDYVNRLIEEDLKGATE